MMRAPLGLAGAFGNTRPGLDEPPVLVLLVLVLPVVVASTGPEALPGAPVVEAAARGITPRAFAVAAVACCCPPAVAAVPFRACVAGGVVAAVALRGCKPGRIGTPALFTAPDALGAAALLTAPGAPGAAALLTAPGAAGLFPAPVAPTRFAGGAPGALAVWGDGPS